MCPPAGRVCIALMWLAGPWRYHFQMGHPTDLQSESHWNWNMVMQSKSRPPVWCWLTFSWLVLNLARSHCLSSRWHKKAFIWVHCPAQKTDRDADVSDINIDVQDVIIKNAAAPQAGIPIRKTTKVQQKFTYLFCQQSNFAAGQCRNARVNSSCIHKA